MERPCKNQRQDKEKQEITAYRRVSRSVEGTAKIFACHVFAFGDPARPRKTRTAWLSRTISWSSSRPTLIPTLDLGTIVILSTINRHGECKPLCSFGSTGRRNSGASISVAVLA
jgi:hypothetical protein